MATRERPVDRGTQLARDILSSIGREMRIARRNRGLSLDAVGESVDRSRSWLSRAERGLVPTVAVLELAQVCAVVGLDLSVKAFPGGDPIRDAGHNGLLESLHRRIHRSLGWAGEVPFPNPGDQRAWDRLIRGDGWRYGVEAETHPIDVQATARRVLLKARDGGVDGVILVLPTTRHARRFHTEFVAAVGMSFPVPGARALELLGAGIDPGGNAVILVPRQSGSSTPVEH
jgi:transcriptional regulator with XRE-family HTH domain